MDRDTVRGVAPAGYEAPAMEVVEVGIGGDVVTLSIGDDGGGDWGPIF